MSGDGVDRREFLQMGALAIAGLGVGACGARKPPSEAGGATGEREDAMKDPKTILCYGDSLTWGWNPTDTFGLSPAEWRRFDRATRWPGVLRSELGDGHVVIEEGLNGRTTVWDDPIEGHKNGKTYLPPCLATHAPLDLVIILLGTNELKGRFSLAAIDVAFGVSGLVDIVKKSGAGPKATEPKVLLVCPPPLGTLKGLRFPEFEEMFVGGEAKSKKLAGYYKGIAEGMGCGFLDAGTVVAVSKIDAIHLEAGEQRKLGAAIAKKVREMLA